MPTILANNIVLASETENADIFVESIESALFERVAQKLDEHKTNIGKRIFKEAKQVAITEETDSYDKQDSNVQEAVDYVVEVVLEDRADLDTSIKEASEKYAVSEEKLKEYFTAFFETVQADSTQSNDGTPNQDRMNDEDADKRIRFECAMDYEGKSTGQRPRFEHFSRLKNGTQVDLTEDVWKAIENVHNELTESNQKRFVNMLQDPNHHEKMVNFCIQMVKQ